MKNIYADDLESISFDEMLTQLEAIAQETQRLDFKRAADNRPKLAHLACSFANAEGGIIAIGFDDPKIGVPLTLADPVNISDKERMSIASAINARVSPPLPMELFGYADGDGDRSFLIIRVDRSYAAPHEYLYPELPNLPVRRDNLISRLSLSEIDALRARSEGRPARPRSNTKQGAPMFINQHSNTSADFSIGIQIRPEEYAPHRAILDSDDDAKLAAIVNRSRGSAGDLFERLPGYTTLDGIHFYAGEKPNWMDEGVTKFAPHQIGIDSDGEIFLRFLQNENRPLVQFLSALASAYILAQEVFYLFGLSPFALVHLTFRLDERRLTDKPAFPEYYSDDLEIDLATQSFTDAILMTTVRMLRAMNTRVTTAELRSAIDTFSAANVPSDMRDKWQVASAS